MSISSSTLDQDWFWIERFQNGDQSAFDQIFNKYKTTVVNLAFRFVRDKEAAEDITQEVFIKIYEKKVKVDLKAKFSTWLYRVTVNSATDLLRKKKFLPHSLDEQVQDQEGGQRPLIERVSNPESVSPVRVLQDEELRVFVQKEIARLPEKLRVPILLYQFENLPYLEIASIMEITEKAVEKRIYHAKEHLRKKLSNIYQSLL